MRLALPEDWESILGMIDEHLNKVPMPYSDPSKARQQYTEVLESVVLRNEPGLCVIEPGIGCTLHKGVGEDLSPVGIYVTPRARGEGVASKMLRFAEGKAKEMGFKRMFFSPLVDDNVTWLIDRGYKPAQIVLLKEL